MSDRTPQADSAAAASIDCRLTLQLATLLLACLQCLNDNLQLGSPARACIPKLLLTSAEAAEVLSISERALWQLTKDGDIKAIKIGRSVRYSLQALAEFVARSGGPVR